MAVDFLIFWPGVVLLIIGWSAWFLWELGGTVYKRRK